MASRWALGLMALVSSVLASEGPDLAFEAKLHEIYMNFHNEKMADDQWRALIGSRASEAYRIQSGDTLWGVSKVFFGDGNYWPKIWSLNQEIVNPHLISEENSIHFILGDESEAPAFTITDSAEEGADESEPAPVHVTHSAAEDLDIPPPSQQFKPVLRHIPKSLPDWQKSNSSDYSPEGISFEKTQKPKVLDRSFLPSIIAESYPKSQGRVIEVEGAGLASAQNQYVYVEGEKGRFAPGQKYTVVLNRGKLDNVGTNIERQGWETIVEFQGTVRLTEKVESKKLSSPFEIYRAIVERAIMPVTVDGDLVTMPMIVYDLDDKGPRSSVVAEFIGGFGGNDIRFYGERSVAYINRGSKDGIAKGQILQARSNPSLRSETTLIRQTNIPIGYVKVMDVSPSYSTVVVLKSFQEIRRGDLTGTGALHPESNQSSVLRPPRAVAKE